MCGCFCVGIIDFMLEGKNVLEYTYLLSSNKGKKLKNKNSQNNANLL